MKREELKLTYSDQLRLGYRVLLLTRYFEVSLGEISNNLKLFPRLTTYELASAEKFALECWKQHLGQRKSARDDESSLREMCDSIECLWKQIEWNLTTNEELVTFTACLDSNDPEVCGPELDRLWEKVFPAENTWVNAAVMCLDMLLVRYECDLIE